jgi:hypothetical protein
MINMATIPGPKYEDIDSTISTTPTPTFSFTSRESAAMQLPGQALRQVYWPVPALMIGTLILGTLLLSVIIHTTHGWMGKLLAPPIADNGLEGRSKHISDALRINVSLQCRKSLRPRHRLLLQEIGRHYIYSVPLEDPDLYVAATPDYR